MGHDHNHESHCGCGCEHEEHTHDEDCSCGCDHRETLPEHHHEQIEEEGHHHHEYEAAAEDHHDHLEHCDCGCDHEEHPHTQDECGCDHAHNHEAHHHEHTDHCGCGHAHDHEEHPHTQDECDCDHGHNHEAHHHEHTDHCGCGHAHNHKEHSHDYDNHCGCGHAHSREEDHHEHDNHPHAHIESCSCGHEHHHDHEEQASHQAHRPAKSIDGATRKIYILENLGCANCAAKMEARISDLPGVSEATITFATKQLRLNAVNHDDLLPKIQAICASIESEVKVIPRVSKPKKAAEEPETKKKISEEILDLYSILGGTVLFAGGILLEYFGANEALTIAAFVLAYLILGGEIVLTACKNLFKGHVFDENFLMSVATIGAFAIREYPEAVGVMLFFRIGEYFEHRAVEKSRSQIMDAVDLRPEVVNLITGDDVQAIPAEEAQPGDILLVRPGDRIPLDGVVTDGESRIDTSPVTGEPVPVAVKNGSDVISGCVNTSGQLKIRVEKPLEESMVTRILNSVENAAASKPQIDRFITRFARVYTPFVVFLALATAVIPSLFTGDWNHWVYTALTFLVISCPCALVLSVPLAFFSGIGAGSRIGILFKGGVALEQLKNVKAVVMDKTGTVTEGNFVVQEVIPIGHLTGEELLSEAAGCEQISTHPIANSIVTAAKEQNLPLRKPAALEEIPGHGIKADTEKGLLLVGNRKLMEEYGINLSKYEKKGFGSEVLVALNGEFQGHIVISDTIKADAKSAISAMKKMGITTAMLTGDAKDNAEAVAAETGIDEVRAKLLPEDKLTELAGIRKANKCVMFVGDGINDAPVLASADVGAAMGSGADAAIEAADVVFMNSSMTSIPKALQIARRTGTIAWQNVIFALAIKALVMLLGLAGIASMWMAVFADSGVAMLCVMNSIRILYKN